VISDTSAAAKSSVDAKPDASSAKANQQSAPANALSKQAMDEIIAAAKSDVQTPAPAVTPQAAQAPASNIAAMLNAARGTITVSTPQQVAAPKSDSKPDAAVADKAAPADTAAPAGKAAQNTQSDARDDSRDLNRSISDDLAKADTTPADPAPVDSAPANPAAQTAASSTQVMTAVTPNAVNSTTPAQASVTAHQAPADPQTANQPNISALAAAIAAKSAAGTKTFDIRMDPPELGRVDVHLSVDRDGKVQAMLSAEHPQTLEMLKQDSHNLERSLKDAGLDLSNNSLNFSLKGEGRQGDGGGASTARARSMPNAVVARAEAANASVSNFNYASGDGRLDIRV
jgi:chemotaxis protein MotD